MNHTTLPPMVATLDARLNLMAPAQKKCFLRYRRAYILANRLAFPVVLLSIVEGLVFPSWWIVDCALAVAVSALAAIWLIWIVRVGPIFRRLVLEEGTPFSVTAAEEGADV